MGFKINPLPTLQEESPQPASPGIFVDKLDETSDFDQLTKRSGETPQDFTDIEIHEFQEMSKIDVTL